MTAIIIPRKHYTQPQERMGVDLGCQAAKGIKVLFRGNGHAVNDLGVFTAGGSVVSSAGASGMGIKNGYYSTPGYQVGSGGAGNSILACRTEHFVFDVLSNASLQGIASSGSTATDGGPPWLLQNNAGTLRYLLLGAYRELGPAIAGKMTVVSVTYSDFAPYTTNIYVDGQLKFTRDAYVASPSGASVYLGSGFPAASTNANFLLYVGKQEVIENDADIKEFASNPWQLFRADPIRIYTFPTGAISINSITASSITQTGARITLGLTR